MILNDIAFLNERRKIQNPVPNGPRFSVSFFAEGIKFIILYPFMALNIHLKG